MNTSRHPLACLRRVLHATPLLIRARCRFCNFNDMRNVFWPSIFSFVKTDLINKCILPNPKEDPGKKEKDDWVTVISKSEGGRPS